MKALRLWERAYAVDPTHPELRGYMVKATKGQGIFYYRQDRLEEAIEMWKRTLTLDAKDPKAGIYIRRATAKMKALQEIQNQ